MKRVMVVGQPGAGKSTFAQAMGAITRLPVCHVDHIHWQAGWVERPRPEKDRLCHAVHAREVWIFEGGHSATWPERLARADTLIWLDLPAGLRLWRILRRSLLGHGRQRPDLPDGCPERFDPAFLRYVWRTRHSGRARIAALVAAPPPHVAVHRLRHPRAAARYLADLGRAARAGNLDIPHR